MAGGARRKQRLLSITLYGTLLAACEGRGSSTPAAAASTSNHTQLLTFFALSDWGGESGPPFTTQDELCPAFTTDNDIRMTHSFDTAFIYPPLQVPWYIAPGTPDWQGNVTAQIAYNGTEQSNRRWNMPSRYYQWQTQMPNDGDTIQIIVIDTVALLGGDGNTTAAFQAADTPAAPAATASFIRRRGQRRRALLAEGEGDRVGEAGGAGERAGEAEPRQRWWWQRWLGVRSAPEKQTQQQQPAGAAAAAAQGALRRRLAQTYAADTGAGAAMGAAGGYVYKPAATAAATAATGAVTTAAGDYPAGGWGAGTGAVTAAPAATGAAAATTVGAGAYPGAYPGAGTGAGAAAAGGWTAAGGAGAAADGGWSAAGAGVSGASAGAAGGPPGANPWGTGGPPHWAGEGPPGAAVAAGAAPAGGGATTWGNPAQRAADAAAYAAQQVEEAQEQQDFVAAAISGGLAPPPAPGAVPVDSIWAPKATPPVIPSYFSPPPAAPLNLLATDAAADTPAAIQARETAAEIAAIKAEATPSSEWVAQAVAGTPSPAVDETQWEWIEDTLSASECDWIVVVGYHSIWSAGPAGPTYPLISRLEPLLSKAGVALYLSGGPDPAQHITPMPPGATSASEEGVKGTPTADYFVVGPAAYAPAEEPEALPNADAVPPGLMQFNYSAGPTFLSVSFVPAGLKQTATVQVTFFDETEAALYSFSKENPRTEVGHTAGNLKAPPGPSIAADARYSVRVDTKPLILLGAGFILIGIAVLAYSLGAASGAKKPLAALKSRVTARRKPVVPFQDDSLGAGPGAAGAGGADETTPLLPDGAGGTAVRRVPSRNATRPGAAWFLRSASAARMAPPQDPAGGVTQQL